MKQQKPIWIDIKIGAEILGNTPEVLRKKIRKGELNIGLTHNGKWRRFRVNKNDIDRVLLENSNITR